MLPRARSDRLWYEYGEARSMKVLSTLIIGGFSFVSAIHGSETLDRARQMIKSGDAMGARNLLAQTAQRNSSDVTSLTEYAEFLDRFGDPAARTAYIKVLDARSASREQRAAAARRLIALDLLAGDTAAAQQHAEAYK